MAGLHYKVKEAAFKKYGTLQGDDLGKAVNADKNNYTEEEVAELVEHIEKTQKKYAQGPKDKLAEEQPDTAIGDVQAPANKLGPPEDPNKWIRPYLKVFDYAKLTSESFKKYCMLVQSLTQEAKYDFELYHVEVIKRDRYRGVKDTPVDTVGFRMRNTTPINKTRIPVKHALSMNGRVEPFLDEQGDEIGGFETIGCQLDHNGINGRYYLLKK